MYPEVSGKNIENVAHYKFKVTVMQNNYSAFVASSTSTASDVCVELGTILIIGHHAVKQHNKAEIWYC